MSGSAAREARMVDGGRTAAAERDGDGVSLEQVTALLARLAGMLLAASGEGASEVERTVARVGAGFGARTSMVLVPDGAALTVLLGGRTATVAVRSFPDVARLDKVAALKPWAHRVARGGTPLAEAERRLAAIDGAPAPYPWWLKGLGIVLFTVGFAPLMQPTWYEIGSSALLGLVTAVLAVAAGRWPRLARVLPLVAATAVSVLVLEVFARTPAHGGAVLLMLPALFYFVPGDLLSAAAVELAAGFLTTGAVRLVYAVFLLLQLYLGVMLGVYATGGDTSAMFDVAAHADLPRWATFLSWVVFTLGTVLAFAVPWRLLPVLLGTVYLTVAVQSGATKLVGEVGGTFAAAVALGVLATVVAAGPGRPPRMLLALPGFFTLTVGSLGMRGLTSLAGGHPVRGFHDLLSMVTTVVAIAVGLLVGSVLAQRPQPLPVSPDYPAAAPPPLP
ncbi:threonine/serine exporter family protein [Kitasatospora sp. YST-16]|uniref:threonine/serine ThrE exporter family protein n=1 Tax=unclassified Kitasatospora TaxID=2633591 RepID=UPI002100DA42|nr:MULTISPECIES: threonine/serine exporter family protein [unclassified Kitasatospora]WAL75674.1 threonine/serine exporter family protein [Kitasatospora sp. YST-16]WNW41740.1 threonine/serine exporter family protein [Streptomyces sp. Li-HN-5-13]